MKCSECNIDMFSSSRYHSDSTIQILIFCPKCKKEILGNIEDGVVHTEEDFFIIVDVPSKLTMEQLKTIRALDKSLTNKPILKLKSDFLAVKQHKIGPFWPHYLAHDIQSKLKLVGLNALVI